MNENITNKDIISEIKWIGSVLIICISLTSIINSSVNEDILDEKFETLHTELSTLKEEIKELKKGDLK